MMFMMPTPPTIRLSAAMMPRMILALARRWLMLVMALSCVWNPKLRECLVHQLEVDHLGVEVAQRGVGHVNGRLG
jgi:hypothetical protein